MSITDEIIDAASDKILIWPGHWYSRDARREEMREVLEIAYRAGRIAQAEGDARIARAHKGSAQKKRGAQSRHVSQEAIAEILAEERGEDIAAVMIAAAIFANAERLRAENEGDGE